MVTIRVKSARQTKREALWFIDYKHVTPMGWEQKSKDRRQEPASMIAIGNRQSAIVLSLS